MFKYKKEKRAFEIFKILLNNNQSGHIESDIIKMYIRATEITNTIDNLEIIYKIDGKISYNKLISEKEK